MIDIDHWRHFYLLLGIVWGGIALEAQYQSRATTGIAAPRPGSGGSLLSAS